MLSNPRHSIPTSNRAVDPVFGSRLAPALLLSVALIIGAAHPLAAQERPDEAVLDEGKSDFEWHCTNCHGPNGKGDGPMAKLLIEPPADLTAIAKPMAARSRFGASIKSSWARKRCPGTRPSRCRSSGSASAGTRKIGTTPCRPMSVCCCSHTTSKRCRSSRWRRRQDSRNDCPVY